MAQDFTKGGGVELAWTGNRGISVQQLTIDFSKTPASSAEVLAAFIVPKNTWVMKIAWECVRAEGSAATVNIGDGATPAGYASAFSVNALAAGSNQLTLTEGTPNTITGFSNGKFYTATDTIDVIPSANLANAILKLAVFFVSLDVDR